ncbi:MAG: hypothetical protein QXO09_07540 [Candidatus Caldarchaeum sp.]
MARVSDYEKSRDERASGGRRGIPVIRMDVGGKIRVRFLADYPDGVVLFFHEGVRTKSGRTTFVACFRNEEYREKSGGVCPYCDEGMRRTRRFYWPVWDYANNDVKLLAGKDTSYGIVSTLREYYESEGTICDRDWTIVRRPDPSRPNSSVYRALPDSKSSFNLVLPDSNESGVSVPSYEDIVRSLEPMELRD